MKESVIDKFNIELERFKNDETPESMLVVAENQDLIGLVLAWSKIAIKRNHKETAFDESWNDVECWLWLWERVDYQDTDLQAASGIYNSYEKKMRLLFANRILYPDGSVHSYVTRYLRDRVVKMFESKPKRTR